MQYQFSGSITEPITYAQAKAHLRINSDDQTYVEALITQVRKEAENLTGRALVVKTVVVYYDEWEEYVKLPFPNHGDISEVLINGEDVTADIIESGLTQKTILVPSTTPDFSAADGGLKVTYATVADYAPEMYEAMMKEINDLYFNRGNFIDVSGYRISTNFQAACLNHKVL